jgi:hypothetical protein
MQGRERETRHGAAMLLVLISLAMATIVTMAYVASRDNSTEIGENVADAAAARWAAVSALETGVAIMQTHAEWQTAHTDGLLLDDHAVGDATVDLSLEDVLTGKPPTAESEIIKLTAIAVINGVEQIAIAVAEINPEGEGQAIDLDLSEFAIFAGDLILLDDQSTVTRWPSSPMAALGRPLAVGTQATRAATVKIRKDAVSIDTTVFTSPLSSDVLVINTGDVPVGTIELSDTIPMPAPPRIAVRWPSPTEPHPDNPRDGGVIDVVADQRVNMADLSNDALSHWFGDITVVSDHDFLLRNGARVLIEDRARLVVFGRLLIDGGSIELADGASLEIFVGDELDVIDGYIGDAPGAGAPLPTDGSAGWIDPERVRIYTIAGAPDVDRWELRGGSVVKASIYAPGVREFRIQNTSALYGRVAAQGISVINTGSIFYDHFLARDGAFTNSESDLYNDDGTLKDSIKLLATLDDGDVLNAALLEDMALEVGDEVFNKSADEAAPEYLDGVPTPRPVPVGYTVTAFGSDLAEAEERASGG